MNRSPDCLMDAGCVRAPGVQNSQFSHQQGWGVKERINKIANTLSLWNERSRQRKELKVLAHHPKVLKDIGVSRYDVQRESRKPFWRA